MSREGPLWWQLSSRLSPQRKIEPAPPVRPQRSEDALGRSKRWRSQSGGGHQQHGEVAEPVGRKCRPATLGRMGAWRARRG
jgi:hypothetical protein